MSFFFHKLPDISNFKVFGSACYPFLRPYNHDKLDSRTTQCVFLGYALGYKGLFCYSITHNKLWMSRHVIHDESIFPFSLSPCSTSSSSIEPVTFFPSSSLTHLGGESNECNTVLDVASSSVQSLHYDTEAEDTEFSDSTVIVSNTVEDNVVPSDSAPVVGAETNGTVVP